MSAIDSLKEIRKHLATIEKQREVFTVKVSDYDLLLCDIYHDLEFAKMDAVSLSKAVKDLRVCLSKRREAKEELAVLQTITQKGKNTKGEVDVLLKQIEQQSAIRKTYKKRIDVNKRKELLKND